MSGRVIATSHASMPTPLRYIGSGSSPAGREDRDDISRLHHDEGEKDKNKQSFRRRTLGVVAHADQTRGVVAHVSDISLQEHPWSEPDGWDDNMEEPEYESESEDVVAAAYDDGRGPLRLTNRPDPRGADGRTPRQLDPLDAQAAPYKIDFKVVQIAAAEDDGPRKRLAIILFPEDASCKTYWKKGEEEGYPKATVIQRDEHGNPLKRAFDGSIDVRYGAPASCRFCKFSSTNQNLRIPTNGWTEEIKSGSHNPRTCTRAIIYMMKQGAVAADFLMDRKWIPKGGPNR